MKEVPKEIGILVDLKYFDLSQNTYLKRLPRSLCNLYNLQTLRLAWCTSLKFLSEGMGKLINLKHLHVKDCNKLKYFPKGIGRLTSLQRLDEYNVCGGDDEEEFKVGDLGNLKQLQARLLIKKLGNVKDVEEAKKAQLGNKEHLLHLELDFENEDNERRENDANILEALKPHNNLKFLRIGGYNGVVEGPIWRNDNLETRLNCLRSLVRDEWKYCETLPPLGLLFSLERLEISGMHSLKILRGEILSYAEFPSLKQLSFRMMHEWQGWKGREGITVMPLPRLSSLRIKSCSLLKTLPYFLQTTPLQDLTLNIAKKEPIYGPSFLTSQTSQLMDSPGHKTDI